MDTQDLHPELQLFSSENLLCREICKYLNIYAEKANNSSIVHFFFRFNYFYSCVQLFCLQVRLFSTCVPDAHGGQKRALNPPETGVTMVVSCYVGARNSSK